MVDTGDLLHVWWPQLYPGNNLPISRAGSVTVTLNVNHSVDSDPEAEDLSESQGSEQLKARPAFNVDIVKGNRTVSFTCSYTEGGVVEQQGEQYSEWRSGGGLTDQDTLGLRVARACTVVLVWEDEGL